MAEGSNTINPKDVTSITSALTFTYEEYLKLFVLIGSFVPSKEKAMLTNVAKLMQVNLTKGIFLNPVNTYPLYLLYENITKKKK